MESCNGMLVMEHAHVVRAEGSLSFTEWEQCLLYLQMKEVQLIKLQASPHLLVFHDFPWLPALYPSMAESVRSPKGSSIHGVSVEKTMGREKQRAVSLK